MTRWQPEWALELALGTLHGEDREAALAVLASSPAARAEVAAARELVSGLPSAGDAPRPELRAQVLKATEPLSACLGGFARRVAELFDIGEDEARAMLATIDAGMTFEPSLVPGVELAHVDAGARLAGADSGIVRMRAGLAFPLHEHVGAERQVVLAGAFVTNDGREYLPGDELAMDTGTRHSFVVGKDEPCVIAVVLHADIRILPGAG